MRFRELMALYTDLLKPQRKMILFAVLFTIFKALMESPVPKALGYLTNRIAQGDFPWFNRNWVYLAAATVAYAAAYAPVTYYRSATVSLVAFKAFFSLRIQLFNHLQGLSADFFVRSKTGDLNARLINDIQVVSSTVIGLITRIAFDAFMFIPSLYFMLTANRLMTVIVLAFGGIQVFFALLMVPELERRSKAISEKLGEISSDAAEKLDGNALVKAMAVEQQVIERFKALNTEHLSLNIGLLRYSMRRWMFIEATYFVFPIAMMLVGFLLARAGRVTVGDVVAMVFYLPLVTGAMQRFAEAMTQWPLAMVCSMARIQEILTTLPSVQDKPGAPALPRPRGRIRFDHVHFRYPAMTALVAGAPPPSPDASRQLTVIQDFDLEIEPGQVVAIVGPSGSGKTTLSQLLMRFYDVDRGAISIDGRDIRDVTQESLRKSVGIVMQKTMIFSGTILDNLRFAKPDATDLEVRDALKFAALDDFVARLPAGIQTMLGEKGVNLSGGQQQRLSIARVFLENPAILILDEATSSLDSISEAAIKQELDRLMSGRTAIVIAHRLSTIRDADRIVVLNNGRIQEVGTHEQLLASAGAYSLLVAAQTKPAPGP